MQVKVHVPVFPGDIPSQVCDLHLFVESLVDVFKCGWVQEAEGRGPDRSEACYLACRDSFPAAEFCQGGGYPASMVDGDDDGGSMFLVLVHDLREFFVSMQ